MGKQKWLLKRDSAILYWWTINWTSLLKKKKASISNQPSIWVFLPSPDAIRTKKKSTHTTPGHPRSNQKIKLEFTFCNFCPRKSTQQSMRLRSKMPVDIAEIAGATKDLSSGRMMSKACAPARPWFMGFHPQGFTRFFCRKNTWDSYEARIAWGINRIELDPRSMVWWVYFWNYSILPSVFESFLLLFSVQKVLHINIFTWKRWDSSSPSLLHFIVFRLQKVSIESTPHPLANEGIIRINPTETTTLLVTDG